MDRSQGQKTELLLTCPAVWYLEEARLVLVLLGANGRLDPEKEVGHKASNWTGQQGEDPDCTLALCRTAANECACSSMDSGGRGVLTGRPPTGCRHVTCYPSSRACKGGMWSSCTDKEAEALAQVAQPGIHPRVLLLLILCLHRWVENAPSHTSPPELVQESLKSPRLFSMKLPGFFQERSLLQGEAESWACPLGRQHSRGQMCKPDVTPQVVALVQAVLCWL